MAFLSFADANRHVDMRDQDLVRFGSADGAFDSSWSWLTPAGHDLDLAGTDLTYDANGRALSGRINLIQIDLDNDDGLSNPDIKITGVSAPARDLDDNPFEFWNAVLDGTDIINAQGLSVENVGTTGVSYVLGDDIAATLTTSAAIVGDRGGNDVITLGTAAATAVGDIRSVTGNVDNLFATYEGGRDQVLAPVTDQIQKLSGDADIVAFFGTLIGGDDLVQTGSTSSLSSAVGDAFAAIGVSADRRGLVVGGDDEVESLSGSRATLVGDLNLLGSFADVIGGADTIKDSNADAGQATRLAGDVHADQSGGSSSIVGGNDTIHGNGGRELIAGDLFFASVGTILAGGNDTLFGGDGDDVLFGEAGSEDPTLFTGISAGDDQLFGGAGSDRLLGQTGDDTLDSGVGDDTLIGHAGDDFLDGRAGRDVLGGGGGEDTLDGGGDDDTLLGHAGDDSLDGGGQNDSLNGGGGDDSLAGGAGADTLTGHAGSDTADYSGSGGSVTVSLAAGVASGGDAAGDVLSGIENLTGSEFGDNLTGDGNVNRLVGNIGDDSLSGGAGNDTLAGGAGADTLTGHAGSDTADYSGSGGGVTVVLASGFADGADATGDVLSGIESLRGSGFGDELVGDGGANLLNGGAGDDSLGGGGGNDTLIGGAGADTLTGHAGNDRFVFGDGTGQDRITDFAGGAGIGDVIDLSGNSTLNNFADVQAAASQTGADTLIDMGGGGTLTLESFIAGSLAADDLLF